ncbi:MAG: type II secretion system F family protein [Infirmifilum sp.]
MSLPYALGKYVVKVGGERLNPFRDVFYRAGFSMIFEEYVGWWFTAFLATTPIVTSLSMALHHSVLGYPLHVSALLTLIVDVTYALLTTAACLYYPVYRRGSRGWSITSKLPYTLAHVSVLASSGMRLPDIFRHARDVEDNKDIRRELDLFLTDVELLGFDTLSAIERAIRRSPSAALSLFLSGLRDAYLTGRSLYEYTAFTASRLLEAKRSELSSVVNSVATVAEMYTTLMVAAPLMFVIMLSIISMLGGSLGGLPANMLIALIVLVLVPASALAILVILDAVLSKV